MLNIAFLGNQWLPHTYERMDSLENLGHKVYFFTWPQKENKLADNIFLLPYPFRIRYLIPNIRAVKKLIKTYNIDVIHIMGIVNGIYSFFIKSVKIVVEHNGSDILLVPKQLPYYKYYYKLIYLFTDGVIQDSAVSKNAGIQLGAPKNNNEIINIGVDINIFNPNLKKNIIRSKYNINKNQKIILHPRGLRELYNPDIIIKSINMVKKLYPDVVYIFCGYYDHIHTLHEEVKKMDITNNVLFVGHIDRIQELPYFYSDADIVISIPSSDSSPLSVYEAMACATPIIVSDLPWLNHKFGKYSPKVIPVRDVNKLSDAIIELLSDSRSYPTTKLFEIVNNYINKNNEAKNLETFYYNL
jgi:glycosyltransferase involved in cell wall biosynthesis